MIFILSNSFWSNKDDIVGNKLLASVPPNIIKTWFFKLVRGIGWWIWAIISGRSNKYSNPVNTCV